jgi:DNA-binding PadR family transcriptional regulator
VGRRPARTVYEITEEGHLELAVQRDAVLDVIFSSMIMAGLWALALACYLTGALLAVRQR